jgi:capsular exopolysaccharide synthesis family protein
MEKVLAGRDAAASRPAAPSGGVSRAPDEPLVDAARVELAGWAAERLLGRKVVAQLMDGQRAWSGHRRAVEALRMVRTRALHALEAAPEGVGSIAVTSPRQGDGKTLVSANLAFGIARQTKRRVLLVDGDLRLPSIAKALDLDVKYGLSDYLAGDVEIERCMVKSADERLFVLPQRKSMSQAPELLANGVLTDLMDTVRTRYPDWLVLVDSPPILAVDDTLVILRAVDKALLVLREGRTRRGEMRRAAEAIGREKYLGAVLNDSRSHGDSGRYYYYDYGYERR